MSGSSSAVGLLRLLLGLPPGTPVYATPSFAEWLPGGQHPVWPPAAKPGVVLIDSADIPMRRIPIDLHDAFLTQHQAVIILAGAERRRPWHRSTLRRFLWRTRPRAAPRRIEQSMDGMTKGMVVTRLGFDDDSGIPSEFTLSQPADRATAFLITPKAPFGGGLWALVAQQLAEPACSVSSFQLRARGAAIAILHSARRDYVVRVVEDADLARVVMRNHESLSLLRSRLAGELELLERLPEPLAALEYEGATVLAETLLPGTLAWRLDSGEIGARACRESVAFLDALRRVTCQDPVRGVDELVRADVELTTRSAVPGRAVRDLILDELAYGTAALREIPLSPHASHGDFGFGNVLIDDATGGITGVIDWDTSRLIDVPGIDRVNFEIQLARGRYGLDFAAAARAAYEGGAVESALAASAGAAAVRPLFGLAVCRYILRSFTYPAVYAQEEAAFEHALRWLAGLGR